jgi:hypothetical protein
VLSVVLVLSPRRYEYYFIEYEYDGKHSDSCREISQISLAEAQKSTYSSEA